MGEAATDRSGRARVAAEFAPFVPVQTGPSPRARCADPRAPGVGSPPHAGPALGSSDGTPHPATGDTSTATAAGSLLAGRYRLGTRVAPTPPPERSSGGRKTPCCAATSPPPCCAVSARDRSRRRRGAGRAEEIIARALRSGSFEHPAAHGCWTCSPPAPPVCRTGCSAPPSRSGCPGAASPRPSRTGSQAARGGPRAATAGGRRRSRAPARARAGLRPPPAGAGHPRGPHADGLRLAPTRAHPRRRRPRARRGAVHPAHRPVALSPSDAARAGLARRSAPPAARPSRRRRPPRRARRARDAGRRHPRGERHAPGPHRGRRAHRRGRGRGRGGPRRAVPARARRRAPGARRRLAAARCAAKQPDPRRRRKLASGWRGWACACSGSPGT